MWQEANSMDEAESDMQLWHHMQQLEQQYQEWLHDQLHREWLANPIAQAEYQAYLAELEREK